MHRLSTSKRRNSFKDKSLVGIIYESKLRLKKLVYS